MTPGDATDGEPEAPQGAMPLDEAFGERQPDPDRVAKGRQNIAQNDSGFTASRV